MATSTIENYLKALNFLSQESNDISLSSLSRKMEVSAPTVNHMIKKLQEKGWVEYQKYKPIKLTNKGKLESAIVIRKHRLTEMFLVKIMGFGWEEVHNIAEEIEHLKSDSFFDRMDELLGFPKYDPHGSPIPNKQGKIPKQNFKLLSEINENKKVVLMALKDSSIELLDYLNKRELQLGNTIQIISRELFDKSAFVRINGSKEIMMTFEVCQCLMVKEF